MTPPQRDELIALGLAPFSVEQLRRVLAVDAADLLLTGEVETKGCYWPQVHAVGLTAYLKHGMLVAAARAAGILNFNTNPSSLTPPRTYVVALQESTPASVHAVVRRLIASKTG